MNKDRIKKLRYLPSLLIGWILAKIISLFSQPFIVLVGNQRGREFDDNGKAMYEYLRENQEKIRTYWCFDKQNTISSSELSTLNGVQLGTISNYMLYYRAKVVFFSHSNGSDIAPLTGSIPFKQPLRVSLSHGVQALKKKDPNDGVVVADLYVCNSNFDQQIKVGEWGVPEDQTIVTGIPRFDRYTHEEIRTSIPSKRLKILYLPTWREWDLRASVREFQDTESYQEMKSLLANQELLDTLADSNIELHIMLHPFFQQYQATFDEINSEYIVMDSGEISKKIVSMDALVTDYSSIAVDFFYLNKPTIFFQYDQQTFLEKRGSYLDLKSGLFGPIVFNLHQLSGALKDVRNIDLTSYQATKELLFQFTDGRNAQRVWTETLNKLNKG